MYFWYLLMICLFVTKHVKCDSLLLTEKKNVQNFPNVTTSNCLGESTAYKGIERNVLRCARRCMNDDQCKGLVYNETKGECEVIGGEPLSATSQELSGSTYEVTKKNPTEECAGTWDHILAVIDNSAATIDEFARVKDALQSGHKLRINCASIHTTLHFHINSARLYDAVICGQSEVYISGSEDNEIISFIVCTDGHVQQLRRIIGSEDILAHNKLYIKCDWFVLKDECRQQLYINDINRPRDTVYDILSGSQAFSITTLQTTDTKSTINYRTDVVFTSVSRQVTLTSQGELSKVMVDGTLSFDINSAFISNEYSFGTNITESSCYLTINSCDTKTEHVSSAYTFINLKWKKVFHHLSDGETVYGSVCLLREHLLAGNRLLVNFEGRFREPDITVIVGAETLSAVFVKHPSTEYNASNAQIVWEILSTCGRYQSLVFDYVTGEIFLESSSSKEGIWFIDEAKWTNVNNDNITSLTELHNAVDSGAEIRIKSSCLYENGTFSGTFSTEHICLYYGDRIIDFDNSIRAKTRMFPGIAVKNSRLCFDVQNRIPTWMTLEVRSKSETNPGWLWRKTWAHENITAVYVKETENKTLVNNAWYAR